MVIFFNSYVTNYQRVHPNQLKFIISFPLSQLIMFRHRQFFTRQGQQLSEYLLAVMVERQSIPLPFSGPISKVRFSNVIKTSRMNWWVKFPPIKMVMTSGWWILFFNHISPWISWVLTPTDPTVMGWKGCDDMNTWVPSRRGSPIAGWFRMENSMKMIENGWCRITFTYLLLSPKCVFWLSTGTWVCRTEWVLGGVGMGAIWHRG